MAKVLFPLYLEPHQFEYIDKLAKESGNSRASVVRGMIEKDQRGRGLSHPAQYETAVQKCPERRGEPAND